jgi:hypothetical protein
MELTRSERGFEFVIHPAYVPPHDSEKLVSQSSAIGDYPDSMERPGSSYLWIGYHHHLNREEVAKLAEHLRAWLATGSLQVAEGLKTGAELIAAERQRQIEVEDWSADHDDQHADGSLVHAAVAYACAENGSSSAGGMWPWDADSWKPKDRVRNLVRAAALLAAEIDRLQRAEAAEETK